MEEANLWVEACRIAISGSVRRADLPWKGLLDAGRLLSLNGNDFEQLAHAVKLGDEEEGKKVAEKKTAAKPSRGRTGANVA